MAVLNPLKLVITNYPENQEEFVSIDNNPEDETMGTREMPFSREIYIEQDDFMEDAPKKFFRLAPDKEVRLKAAYIIKCEEVIKDSEGKIIELRCTYDTDSKSGSGTEASQRKVKGTLHWVSAKHAIDAEVRLYDRLFTDEAPDGQKDKDYKDFINSDSLKVLKACKVEPSLGNAEPESKYQFQRLGYFCADRKDSKLGNLVFNRTVPLKDSWSKKNK
jgi:glutaminyl-tRNA synthetase